MILTLLESNTFRGQPITTDMATLFRSEAATDKN
jgi:hypothetical protein